MEEKIQLGFWHKQLVYISQNTGIIWNTLYLNTRQISECNLIYLYTTLQEHNRKHSKHIKM